MKAARVSGYLRDVVWKNRYLTTENKVKVYKTMVRASDDVCIGDPSRYKQN